MRPQAGFAAALLAASMLSSAIVRGDTDASFEKLRDLRSRIDSREDVDIVIHELRSFVASKTEHASTTSDSLALGYARYLVFKALIADEYSPEALIAAADSTKPFMAREPEEIGSLYQELATALAASPEVLDRAIDYARQAVRLTEGSDYFPLALRTEARLRLRRTDADVSHAMTQLERSLETTSADSAWTLYMLGRSYKLKGDLDHAIDAYIRCDAAYPGGYYNSDSVLKVVYRQHHGNLDGLEDRLATARETSRRQVALEAPRYEKPAPGWNHRDLSGKRIQSRDLHGKVAVIDFWATWCPPCREGLPELQTLAAEYAKRGVAVLAMNVDQAEGRRSQAEIVRSFADGLGGRPRIVLADTTTASKFGVESFPTTYVMDGRGMIRYRNVGWGEQAGAIIREQLESLLKHEARK